MKRGPSIVLPKKWLASPGPRTAKASIQASPLLIAAASASVADVFARMASRPEGLASPDAQARLAAQGPNVLARDQGLAVGRLVRHAVVNPLVILLTVLAAISFATDDPRAGVMMLLMIGLGVGLTLVQEFRAGNAAAKLKALIWVAATVVRDGTPRELPVAQLVPGDIVRLAAGDIIPGDVRIVDAKDLFVNQGSLTGEAFPVEKHAAPSAANKAATPIELSSIAFLGTSVESGAATALIVATGNRTYLGGMAETLTAPPAATTFEKGISRLTWMMLRFILVMVPLVFVINGFSKGSWSQAFFFALAVAVGLTPEMLPMIVTVCLAKGAVAMSRKKVIVKHLDAIQNLGAMDVLCTDKTGTLTMDQVTLQRYCNLAMEDDVTVLALAYANSHCQTGLKSVLDRAILARQELARAQVAALVKVDEIPFDFGRRIMSVVVRTPEGHDRIISKGAPEAIFGRCTTFLRDGQRLPMDQLQVAALKDEYERLSADGFRVLAIACKDGPVRAAVAGAATPYGRADECDLVLRGYLAFLDPPKESAATAIAALQAHGVTVKVITGDNDLVARKICKEVGLATDHVLLGTEVEGMTDDELATAAESVTLFARVSPAHKQRIIAALQSRGHTVGFMGDGINDAPALHTADVGISVDTAVDIAKESADMILLEKSLMVLDEGVIEGRKVFANIVKYVRMGTSSNFGNMFSVLGASLFLPFLPLLPIQILANNLLYDIGQTTVPSDAVDPEQLARPRPWDIKQLMRFIAFIGPCSSVFDYTTFFIMLYVFGCHDVSTPAAASHSASLFRTGWFVESLLTQALVIHVIRTNKVPFLQSRASRPVMGMSLMVVAVGVALPFSPLGRYLGFTALPALYWPLLALTLLAYLLLTQGVKAILLRKKCI